jgi:hypothetical protein
VGKLDRRNSTIDHDDFRHKVLLGNELDNALIKGYGPDIGELVEE